MAQVNSAEPASYWSQEVSDLLRELQSRTGGLAEAEASTRLAELPGTRSKAARRSPLWLFLAQLKSSITIILILAAVLSFFLRDPGDATIILFIIVASAALGFWQEYSAASALDKLLALVNTKATVLRSGHETQVAADRVVPGDVIMLSAGSNMPGDCVIVESKELFVDEAALTGETFPVEKSPGTLPADTALAKRSNALFMGTHVISGSATAVIVGVGDNTEFGRISQRLTLRAPETDFERGVRRFGYFLTEVTLILVVLIFAMNVFFQKPVVESFLFSLALAVGLTPQLLPAIISVNLAHGARRMAKQDVIVRRLSSIENFGSMNVLCSDKTGTLTQGTVQVHETIDAHGQASEKVARYAFLNAAFETGFTNPIDEAIRAHMAFDLSAYQKLDECPYDFVRKRLSVLVQSDTHRCLITKGALDNVLEVCDHVETGERVEPIGDQLSSIRQRYVELGDAGYRTLGVAYRQLDEAEHMSKAAEREMVFLGFLILRDPPKEGIAATVKELATLGVSLKMITGDNVRVAGNVAAQVGLSTDRIVTGSDLRKFSDAALVQRVNAASVFAEVEPNQKERIILACKKAGNVVGYMGDGINDATALHAADVGISVDQAVDVAKEAADIVLLKQDLGVLVQGVREGRKTFANTMKYVFMATSANFGNMFSMAGASLFLKFLPLLPKQILLMNLMTDLPEMSIAGDAVDDELAMLPQRWDIGFIRRFMLVFGAISSVFDFLTFGVLLFVLKANERQFRTGWFWESVVSATLVVLIIRTRRPLTRSLPSRALLVATGISISVTTAVPWTPLASVLGFEPLPGDYLFALATVVTSYVVTAEYAKAWFYRQELRRFPRART